VGRPSASVTATGNLVENLDHETDPAVRSSVAFWPGPAGLLLEIEACNRLSSELQFLLDLEGELTFFGTSGTKTS
jgi:hypothetical protein